MVYLAIQHFDLLGVDKPCVIQPTRETPKCYYNDKRRYLKDDLDQVNISGGNRYQYQTIGTVYAIGETPEEATSKTKAIIKKYLERMIAKVK